MFGGVWLTLKRPQPDRMEYSVALGFRLVFMLIAGLLLVALSTAEGAVFRSSNWLAFLLLAISVLAAVYREQWVFDVGSGVIEYRIGLLFLSRLKVRPLEQIAHLRLSRTRLAGRRNITALELVDSEGQPTRLDMVREGGSQKLTETANLLGDFCGLSVEGVEEIEDEDDQSDDRGGRFRLF
jgi:hypothetical protein